MFVTLNKFISYHIMSRVKSEKVFDGKNDIDANLGFSIKYLVT